MRGWFFGGVRASRRAANPARDTSFTPARAPSPILARSRNIRRCPAAQAEGPLFDATRGTVTFVNAATPLNFCIGSAYLGGGSCSQSRGHGSTSGLFSYISVFIQPLFFKGTGLGSWPCSTRWAAQYSSSVVIFLPLLSFCSIHVDQVRWPSARMSALPLVCAGRRRPVKVYGPQERGFRPLSPLAPGVCPGHRQKGPTNVLLR